MSCAECFMGSVHDHEEIKGSEETIHGYRTYVAGGAGASTSKSTILFLTDAFGLKLVNNKTLADKYAAATGCRVLVPDIIPGGGADVSMLVNMDVVMKATAWTDVLGWLKRGWALINTLIVAIPFFIRADVKKAYPNVVTYARAVKASLPPGGKLGVSGFCYGGYGSTRLCAEPVVEGSSAPLIDAEFCAHPSFLKAPEMIIDAVSTFKVPYAVAVASEDFLLGAELALETQAALREKFGPPDGNDYEIKIYKGCKHGFAVRAAPDDKVGMQGRDDAADQAIRWFNKHLN